MRTATVTLLALAVGCSSKQEPQTTLSSTAPAASPTAQQAAVLEEVASPPPQFDPIVEAEDKAAIAQSMTRSALSKEDQNLAIVRWQEAIALLKTVPNSHPKKALAEQRLAEYQRQLDAAKQQAVSLSQPAVATPTQVSPKAALAQHLKQTGVRMYATYWCGTCRWQEQQFGKEAADIIQSIRVECDPRGKNAKPELCYQAQVSVFPTWEINGELYVGGIPLEKLAEFSGYKGSPNFRL